MVSVQQAMGFAGCAPTGTRLRRRCLTCRSWTAGICRPSGALPQRPAGAKAPRRSNTSPPCSCTPYARWLTRTSIPKDVLTRWSYTHSTHRWSPVSICSSVACALTFARNMQDDTTRAAAGLQRLVGIDCAVRPAHPARKADACSQYKPQASSSVVGTAANATERASDTQLLALLSARLQHGVVVPVAARVIHEVSYGLPHHDQPALDDTPEGPVHTAAAQMGSGGEQPRRQRHAAVATVTPSPTLAGGRQHRIGTGGSARPHTAADTATERAVLKQHGATARVHKAIEAPATPSPHAHGAVAHTVITDMRCAAVQTDWREHGDVLVHDLPPGHSSPEVLQTADVRHRADGDSVSVTERLAMVTSERDAAVAAENETRRALDAQARCCLCLVSGC